MNSIGNEVRLLYDKTPASGREKKVRTGNNKKAIIIAGVAALLLLFYNVESIFWYNTDVKEIAAVYAGAIMIERECKRRDDLVPNLINIAKEYARHERLLFHYVSDARSQIGPVSGMNGGRRPVANGELLSKLIALSEQYPDLKATQSFQDLMDMIETTEDRIASMRENYIKAVEDYNLCNQQFWCPFFTTIINLFCPMPTFIDYYYYKSHFTGEWDKLQAPVMIQTAITEKDKQELLKPVSFTFDSLSAGKQ